MAGASAAATSFLEGFLPNRRTSNPRILEISPQFQLSCRAASCRIAQRAASLLLAASHHRYIVELAFRAPLVAVNATLHETR